MRQIIDKKIFAMAALYVYFTPYTKVEESFNMQAIHDILYLRSNFTQYDHHEFPGVVPRSFLGPLIISALTFPMRLLFDMFDIPKVWLQYVVRLVLASMVTMAWTQYNHSIKKLFGNSISRWLVFLTLSQFHFLFYSSRSLPNIMALPAVLLALSRWLEGDFKHFIVYSGISIIVFRSELLIFFTLLLLHNVYWNNIPIERLFKMVLVTGSIILTTVLIVDSFFWKRFVWPEGEVFWFNTILNQSSKWGTLPYFWYFYSALPRAMGFSLPFVAIGIYAESRIKPLVLSALGFVTIYSFLPHKELRFIIYVIPVLNLAAAAGCHYIYMKATNYKSKWYKWLRCLALITICHLILNLLMAIFLLIVSSQNYAGGVALERLHNLEKETNVKVHISNLAAQTGVTRFQQYRDDWSYCKLESLDYMQPQIIEYTHLILEVSYLERNQILRSNLLENFQILENIECFSHIGLQYTLLKPVRIYTKPCLAILRRQIRKS